MLDFLKKLWENCYLIILSIHILKLEISGCDTSSIRACCCTEPPRQSSPKRRRHYPVMRNTEPRLEHRLPSRVDLWNHRHPWSSICRSPLSSRRRSESGHLCPSLPLVSTLALLYPFCASAESLDARSPGDDDDRSSRPLPVTLASVPDRR
jgi:hypothetical protein